MAISFSYEVQAYAAGSYVGTFIPTSRGSTGYGQILAKNFFHFPKSRLIQITLWRLDVWSRCVVIEKGLYRYQKSICNWRLRLEEVLTAWIVGRPSLQSSVVAKPSNQLDEFVPSCRLTCIFCQILVGQKPGRIQKLLEEDRRLSLWEM